MKKLLFWGSALVMVLAMTSCKSSESAYKKAYEKAQAAQAGQMNAQVVTPQQQTQQTQPVQVTPVTPQQQTTPQTTQDYSNVSVRTETVTLVSGNGLRAFSVVVGSFGLQSNAQTLQQQLAQKGYAAQIVSAVVNGSNFYRVVATTHDTKVQAAQSRATLLGTYPDAWLLYQK